MLPTKAPVTVWRSKLQLRALEEKKTAIVALEAEETALIEKSSLDQQEREQEREQLHKETSDLQNALSERRQKSNKMHADAMDVLKALEKEREDSQQLRSEVSRLEKKCEEMETTMAKVYWRLPMRSRARKSPHRNSAIQSAEQAVPQEAKYHSALIQLP